MGQGVHLAKWGCRQQEGQAQPRLHLQPPECLKIRAPVVQTANSCICDLFPKLKT